MDLSRDEIIEPLHERIKHRVHHRMEWVRAMWRGKVNLEEARRSAMWRGKVNLEEVRRSTPHHLLHRFMTGTSVVQHVYRTSLNRLTLRLRYHNE